MNDTQFQWETFSSQPVLLNWATIASRLIFPIHFWHTIIHTLNAIFTVNSECHWINYKFRHIHTCMHTYIHTYIYIQGVSRLVDITAGGDFLGLCDQESSYKHVSGLKCHWKQYCFIYVHFKFLSVWVILYIQKHILHIDFRSTFLKLKMSYARLFLRTR